MCVSASGILVVSVDVKHDVYLLTATVSVTCIHVHIPLSQILRCSEEARLPHTFTPDFYSAAKKPECPKLDHSVSSGSGGCGCPKQLHFLFP